MEPPAGSAMVLPATTVSVSASAGLAFGVSVKLDTPRMPTESIAKPSIVTWRGNVEIVSRLSWNARVTLVWLLGETLTESPRTTAVEPRARMMKPTRWMPLASVASSVTLSSTSTRAARVKVTSGGVTSPAADCTATTIPPTVPEGASTESTPKGVMVKFPSAVAAGTTSVSVKVTVSANAPPTGERITESCSVTTPLARQPRTRTPCGSTPRTCTTTALPGEVTAFAVGWRIDTLGPLTMFTVAVSSPRLPEESIASTMTRTSSDVESPVTARR
ncbi:MAG: hypothetical protein A3I79_01400 [Gemmatimonadetes bacterium RIFCSPLOWO2_02_FULL_71_11]|nr:MAG: hypothetical protein A3I79_01400 [Gemmatimonadetes bacterium RIFCSPLOWO2_02_FULL_71_11]